ncbi:flippase [Halanaerobium kushneri]|uniref:Membrane protein involved in the export of O-antigen and teichoic acid n=1 Tax=Halanaerobium kushneri TaxID=56779 RepID=A0A1N6RPT7_9FIRM|nr:flippase [Halanaerobium kushneri]SIQ30742.1 Membrane protein involved in the export of O-antigen and teichoic acid [Halanaerobium kushneri]
MKNRVSEEEKKETEKYLKTTAKQSSVVFFGRFLGYILGFFVNFILARLFGARIFGQYSIVKTVVDVIVVFSVLGLDNGIIKYVPIYRSDNKKEKVIEVLRISFVFCMVFSFISLVGVIIFRHIIANNIFQDNNLVLAFQYGAWLIIPFALRRIFNSVFLTLKNIKYYVYSVEVIRRLLIIVILLILYYFDLLNIKYIIIVILLIEIINIFYLVKKINVFNINIKNILNIKLTYDNNEYKNLRNKLLKFSTTVIFIQVIFYLLNKVDRIMLGIYKTSNVVGVYSTAASITILLTFFLNATSMSFSPIISELYHKQNINLLEKLYSAITKWVIILSMPILISIFFYAEDIMLFFGEEYLLGTSTLIILAIAQFINAATGANGYLMNMCGLEKVSLKNDVLMLIFNIILNILLIPKYGILGAAIATSLSVIVFNLFKLFKVNQILNINPYNFNYTSILISLVIVIIMNNYFEKYFNINIILVFFITLISMLIFILIAFTLRDEMDDFIFEKIKSKFKL